MWESRRMRAFALGVVVTLAWLAPERLSAQSPDALGSPRLRFGADSGFGLAWDAEGMPGGSLQTGARLGVQLDRFLGVYYEGQFSGIGIQTERESTVWLLTTSNGIAFDLTLLDTVQLGAGLSIDYLTGDQCGEWLCVGASEGTYLGFGVRVAWCVFTTEAWPRGNRSGVFVGGRWHTTAVPDQRHSGSAGIHSLTLDVAWEIY